MFSFKHNIKLNLIIFCITVSYKLFIFFKPQISLSSQACPLLDSSFKAFFKDSTHSGMNFQLIQFKIKAGIFPCKSEEERTLRRLLSGSSGDYLIINPAICDATRIHPSFSGNKGCVVL